LPSLVNPAGSGSLIFTPVSALLPVFFTVKTIGIGSQITTSAGAFFTN